jgi:hypothetical protein
MSKETIELMKAFTGIAAKGMFVVLLSVLGFLSVDAYTTLKDNVKQTQEQMDKSLDSIQKDVTIIKMEQVRVRFEIEQLQKEESKRYEK